MNSYVHHMLTLRSSLYECEHTQDMITMGRRLAGTAKRPETAKVLRQHMDRLQFHLDMKRARLQYELSEIALRN